jgi:hypothetical protein
MQLQADSAAINRKLSDLCVRLDTAIASVERLESENTILSRELESLRSEQSQWFPPFSASVPAPLVAISPGSPDFGRCVVGWNRVISLTGQGSFSSDPIPLTCNDEWELRGWFQFTGPADMIHYLGLDCYTDRECRSENRITDRSVMQVSDTEAVLAEDCKPGDQILKLRGESVASWPSKLKMEFPSRRNFQCIAFGRNSLPNFNLSPCICRCRVKGDVLEVELYSGMSDGWEAGTEVRMHTGGPSFVFGHRSVIGSEWQEIAMNHWQHPLRAGTKSVKILVLCCYGSNGISDEELSREEMAEGTLNVRCLRWEKRP